MGGDWCAGACETCFHKPRRATSRANGFSISQLLGSGSSSHSLLLLLTLQIAAYSSFFLARERVQKIIIYSYIEIGVLSKRRAEEEEEEEARS